MKIVGYGRVSTREQAENSHALEQQCDRLKAAGVTDIITDVDKGAKDSRLGFKRVMEMVKTHGCDEVVVTRLDRLTRSVTTMRSVIDAFRDSGVNLRALDNAIDFKTASGRFFLDMLAALAEMEVGLLGERVRHGWNHLRNQTRAINPPFGYKVVDDAYCLDFSPYLCLLSTRQEMSKAAIAVEIVEAFLERQTLRSCLRSLNEKYGICTFAHGRGRVARDLFRFSVSGLSNWLTNPVLQGHTCYLRRRNNQRIKKGEWDIRYDTHTSERIITPEQALSIQEILTRNARVRGYGSTALKYPLSGLVFCAECRGTCYSMKGGRGKSTPGYNYYFQCKNWRTRGCSNKQMVQMSIVEEAVVAALVERAGAIAQLGMKSDAPEPLELTQLRAKLAGLRSLGNDPIFLAPAEALEAQIGNFVADKKQQSDQMEFNYDILAGAFEDPDCFKNLTNEKKQQFFRRLVQRIVVHHGEIVSVELKI